MKPFFLILVICACLSGCATAPEVAEELEQIPVSVSWRQAVKMLETGGINFVFEARSLTVWLEDRDGNEFITKAPRADAVSEIVAKLKGQGLEISYVTE